ncbi:MAG: ribonuclease III [Rhodospirillales bacterium]|nr:ribonuclease III [Rhodospirillales bacterium]
MTDSLLILQTRLGHRFARPDLLQEALTHASATPAGKRISYERLEFLGDRVLGLAVAALLLKRFPEEPEGPLAQRFAVLVSRETLAEVASELDLPNLIVMAASEAAGGGRENTATLADVCEAVIGALFLDGGYAAADSMVRSFWQERAVEDRRPPRDPKTALQEWAQARSLPLPHYREIRRDGPPHAPDFTIEVQVAGFPPENGQGRAKRQAERRAAETLLARLENGAG